MGLTNRPHTASDNVATICTLDRILLAARVWSTLKTTDRPTHCLPASNINCKLQENTEHFG